MEFIESPLFFKAAKELLDDEQLRDLQKALAAHPGKGKIIPGSGGLRKIRWHSNGKGKRGGLRVIYYWIMPDHQIYLLYVYKKTEQEELTPEQLKMLRRLMEET